MSSDLYLAEMKFSKCCLIKRKSTNICLPNVRSLIPIRQFWGCFGVFARLDPFLWNQMYELDGLFNSEDGSEVLLSSLAYGKMREMQKEVQKTN